MSAPKQAGWAYDLDPAILSELKAYANGEEGEGTWLSVTETSHVRMLLTRLRFTAGLTPTTISNGRDLVRYLLGLAEVLTRVSDQFNRMDEELGQRRAEDASIRRVLGRAGLVENGDLGIVDRHGKGWRPDETEPGWWLCAVTSESVTLLGLTSNHGPVTVMTPGQVAESEKGEVITND